MNDIFKLYYYELMKNRKKFIFISIFMIVFAITLALNIYTNILGDRILINEISDIIKSFTNNTEFPKRITGITADILNSCLNFYDLELLDTVIFFLGLGICISILYSFDIVFKNYRKNHNNFFVDSMLPMNVVKIKIARILCGLSLYLFFMLGSTIVLLGVNFIMSIQYKGLYSGNIYSLTKSLGPLVFNDFNYTLELVVGHMLVSIVAIQSLTSIFFIDDSRGKYKNKIIFFIITILGGISMFLLIFNRGEYLDGIFLNKENMMINHILLIGLTIILFIADCKITKKRLRGGL